MRKLFAIVVVCLLLSVIVSGCSSKNESTQTSPQPAAAHPCDRACLEGFVEQYLDAAIAHDPKLLPLAADVKFTENGQRLVLPDAHWKIMTGKGKYRLFATDPEAGQVTCFATIREEGLTPEGKAAAIALRLKVENRQITEIESLVVRPQMPMGPPGSAAPAPMFPSAADVMEKMGTPDPVYLEAIPPAERMSREDLIKTATMYSAAWSCKEQFESGLMHFVWRIRDRRYVAVDQERGIVFSFAFFDHALGKDRTYQTPDGRTVTAGPIEPNGWEIAELFKIEKGKIRRIEANMVAPPYGMNSGWSSWEDGLSSAARDVTKSSSK
jgi:hypothetical protein